MGPLFKFAATVVAALVGEKVIAGMLSPETKAKFAAMGREAKAAARSLGTDLGKAMDAVPGKADAAAAAIDRKFEAFEQWAVGPRDEGRETKDERGPDDGPPAARA